jgi:carbonic anhydrase
MFWRGGKGKGGAGGTRSGAEPPAGPGGTPPTDSGPLGDLTPDQALQLLKDGNRDFLTGQGVLSHVSARDLADMQEGQHPFAVVVACADSRTPPTILFNQGLGRLFIVRVAGNTVDRRGLASIVYAVKQLKCPLVVVLGHTGCGAVAAAQAVVEGSAELDPSVEEMITPIIPAVLHAKARGAHDLATASVEENARRVAQRLTTAETALADAIAAGRLKVVAAVKNLNTGEVKFFEPA